MPKFNITYSDGRPVPPEARYFVLRVDGAGSSPKRDAARAAAMHFADLVRDIDREAANAVYAALSGFPDPIHYPDENPR